MGDPPPVHGLNGATPARPFFMAGWRILLLRRRVSVAFWLDQDMNHRHYGTALPGPQLVIYSGTLVSVDSCHGTEHGTPSG